MIKSKNYNEYVWLTSDPAANIIPIIIIFMKRRLYRADKNNSVN